MEQIEKKFLFVRLLKAIEISFRYSTVVKFLNVLKVERERFLRREIVSGNPYFIKIQPTNICHAGCSYCLRHEKNRDLPLGKMSLDNCKTIVDKIKRHAFLVAFQYNGEPLCNDAIFEMIQYAHNCRIGTYLSTNLQDLKRDDRDKLVACGLDLLTVSIDGVSEETYNKHREKGDIKTVLINLRAVIDVKRKLNSQWPFIVLQFIVTKHNQHEIEAVRALAKDLGVDHLALKPVGTTDSLLLPDDKNFCRQREREGKLLKRQMCWWLWGSLVVLWNGTVIPCCHLSSVAKGFNLLTDDLSSIMNNPVHRDVRRMAISQDIPKEHSCSECRIPYGNLLRQTL